MGDQLRRAAGSIALNIAEGTGKPSAMERKRFNAIARGSAMECAAIVDILLLDKLISPEQAAEAKSLAKRLVEMLTKMCR